MPRRARRLGTAASAVSPAPSYSYKEKAEAVWRAGHLEYLLRPYQREVYREIKRELWGTGYLQPSPRQRRFILEICRRWGKSFLCALLAFELCIQKPGAKVYWAAETSKQVRKILRNVLRPLLSRCPEDMRPKWNREDSFYLWPNGSEIHIGGCEDEAKADRLRGDGCDLFIIDEAGSIDILEYVYRNLAVFMALDRSGRVFMPSTPARTPGHAYTVYCLQAEMGVGGYARHDVHSAGFTAKQIEELAEDLDGYDSDDFQREALVQRVIDMKRAVVPEFSAKGDAQTSSVFCAHVNRAGKRCGLHQQIHDELLSIAVAAEGTDHPFKYETAEDQICLPFCAHSPGGKRCDVHFDKHGAHLGHAFEWELERPRSMDCYDATDFGWWPDPTAGLFAYWDFERALTVYEDEFELVKPTTIDIAGAIQAGEQRLWGEYFKTQTHDPEAQRVYKRVGDGSDPQILADLEELHGLVMDPADKHDRDASMNEFRVRFRKRKVRIHPRCRKFRAQLKGGIWDKKRKTYERLKGLAHLDLIDAGRYLSRSVETDRNPIPPAPSHLDGWRKPGDPAHRRRPVPQKFKPLADQYLKRDAALFPSKGKKE